MQWTERTARLTTYHVDNLCGKHHLSCEEVMKVLTEIYVRFHNLSKEKLRKKKARTNIIFSMRVCVFVSSQS